MAPRTATTIRERELIKPIVVKAHDTFGPYRLVTSGTGEPMGHCSFCGKPTVVWMHYWAPRFPADVQVKSTILKKPRNPLGIDCGCYAKLHRQVTHIIEAGLQKGYPA